MLMVFKYLGYQRELFTLTSIHDDAGIKMGVGGVILTLSMHDFIVFHELSCSKCMSIIFRYKLTSYKC